jgi:hypothetical protein
MILVHVISDTVSRQGAKAPRRKVRREEFFLLDLYLGDPCALAPWREAIPEHIGATHAQAAKPPRQAKRAGTNERKNESAPLIPALIR